MLLNFPNTKPNAALGKLLQRLAPSSPDPTLASRVSREQMKKQIILICHRSGDDAHGRLMLRRLAAFLLCAPFPCRIVTHMAIPSHSDHGFLGPVSNI